MQEEDFNKETIEQSNRKKKRKGPIRRFFKFIFVVLFLLIILVIGVGIYLGVNIVTKDNYYGNETIQTIKKENKSLNYVTNYVIYDSISDASSDKKISISLDETNMNYLLNATSKTIDFGPLHVDNMYMYYDNENLGNYKIYMPMSFLFFKTCAYGDATITYDENTDFIDINIKEMKLGKLSSDNWLIKQTVLRFFDANIIKDSFTKINVKSEVGIDGSKVDIKLNGHDIIRLMLNSSSNSAMDLASILYQNLDDAKKVKYVFNDHIGIECELDGIALDSYASNSIEDDLLNIKNNMQTLLDNKICNENNTSLIWTYLVNGYNYLSDNDKTLIKKVDLKSIGIEKDKIENYTGVIDRQEETFDFDIDLKKALELANLVDKKIQFVVSESFFNSNIRQSELVGSTKAYISKDRNSFAYFIVEDVDVSFANELMSISILLDINGCEINISLELSQTNNLSKLETTLSSIKIGTLELNDDSCNTLLKFLDEKIELSFISIDAKNNNITIDFSNLYKKNLLDAIAVFEWDSYYDIVDDYITLTFEKK